MNIQDLVGKKFTREEIDGQILSQGRAVMQVVLSPGWQVILSTLMAVKTNIEKERSNGIKNVTNGERALYFSGKVDGFSQAIDEIYNIIEIANKVEEDREFKKQAEEDNA